MQTCKQPFSKYLPVSGFFLLPLLLCLTFSSAFGQNLDFKNLKPRELLPAENKSQVLKLKSDIEEKLKNTADPEIASEYNKQIITLDRQLIILDELSRTSPDSAETSLSLPENSSEYDISQYDQWLQERNIVESGLQQADLQLKQQNLATDNAQSHLEALQKKIRDLRDNPAPTTETEKQLRLLQAREVSAESWLNLSKLEEKRLRENLAQLQHKLELLDNTISGIRARVVFNQQQLDEKLALLSLEQEKLQSQQTDTLKNLDEAEKRWLQSHQKLIQSGDNRQELTEEFETRALAAREARLLHETLSHALERADYLKHAWEIRFQSWNKTPTHELRPGIGHIDQYLSILAHQAGVLSTQYDALASQYLQINNRLEVGDMPYSSSKWLRTRLDILNRMLNTITTERARLDDTSAFLLRIKNEFSEEITNRDLKDWVSELRNLLSATWHAEVFVFDDQAITLGKLVVGIFLLFTGIWIARLFTRFIGKWMLSRLGLNEGISAAVQTVIFYILLITVVLFALKLINVPLTVFTVIGGALALGIGIGSQNLMSNFMSGLILLAERPIRVGDFVQINNLQGVVSHIGARSTNITTPENIDIIVPNSSFLDDHVTNWTLNDNKIRTSILVGVIYGSNVRDVTKLLKKAADTHGKVLKQPAPIVLFRNFGNDALEFELLIWVNMRRLIERLMIESDLRYQIEHLFREAGIVIAFPQRDVHLDTSKPLELRMMPADEKQSGKEVESDAEMPNDKPEESN